jgi:hypothetical protein
MSSQLAVDDNNELQQVRERRPQPVPLRVAARVVSYIFHPLFIPVYIAWFFVRVQSHLFSVFTEWERTMFIVRFAVMYTMFPLVTVLLLKGLGFIDSIRLKTQRDRVIPYIACGVYYFWMWYVLRNQPEFPHETIILSFAIFLSSSAGLLANIYMKISMHAIACSIMVSFIMLLGFHEDINFGGYISLSFFLAGLICTARLIDSDHTAGEIYWGLILGILCFLVAIPMG